MTIRCIYSEEPGFPATDQHPDAERYKVGVYWVDTMGGKPTQSEIDAVLHPPETTPSDPVAERVAKLEAVLIGKAVLTKSDVDAAIVADVKAAEAVKP